MKVKELMTTNPAACTSINTLADAAGLMWQNDCGILPVVADDGTVIGLITDRDICMAGALNGRQLADIAVEEVASGKVFACAPDDDVRAALNLMQENQIRRVPVVTADGTLEGMLSLNDIVLRAADGKAEISYADVMKTYKAVCEPLPLQAKSAVVSQ